MRYDKRLYLARAYFDVNVVSFVYPSDRARLYLVFPVLEFREGVISLVFAKLLENDLFRSLRGYPSEFFGNELDPDVIAEFITLFDLLRVLEQNFFFGIGYLFDYLFDGEKSHRSLFGVDIENDVAGIARVFFIGKNESVL